MKALYFHGIDDHFVEEIPHEMIATAAEPVTEFEAGNIAHVETEEGCTTIYMERKDMNAPQWYFTLTEADIEKIIARNIIKPRQ